MGYSPSYRDVLVWNESNLQSIIHLRKPSAERRDLRPSTKLQRETIIPRNMRNFLVASGSPKGLSKRKEADIRKQNAAIRQDMDELAAKFADETLPQQIKIKTVDDKEYLISINPKSTVYQIKEEYFALTDFL